MKTLQQLFLCLFLALATTSVDAQVNFTVDQDFSFKTPGTCTGRLYKYTGQDPATISTVTVTTDHNICLTGSPFLASTINQQCWRYYRYYIYNETSQQVYLEAVITKYQYWLQGATSSCFSGQTQTGQTQMQLTTQDLINNGISAGKKHVFLRVEYDFFGQNPHNQALNVSANGVDLCSTPDVENANPNFSCFLGKIGCFRWYPCDVDLNVSSYAQLVYVSTGGQGYWTVKYTFSSNPTGGSGNYSYQWNLNGTSISSTNSSFVFYDNENMTGVSLTVTDNVSGCTYTYYQALKKGAEGGDFLAQTDLNIAPNPISGNGHLKLDYSLSEPGSVQFSLYDLSGRHVQDLSEMLDGSGGENNYSAPLQGVTPGIYFVRMVTENETLTRKLVVQ